MVERESWAAPQDSAIIGNEDRAREVLGSYDQDGVTEVALQISGLATITTGHERSSPRCANDCLSDIRARASLASHGPGQPNDAVHRKRVHGEVDRNQHFEPDGTGAPYRPPRCRLDRGEPAVQDAEADVAGSCYPDVRERRGCPCVC